ncbi:unnamed protein product [Caenorhabditis brenneri]
MNTIPLHLLPEEAYLRVLQSMGIHEQIAYSLCSRNTKKAIKSLKLNAVEIDISVVDSIKINISAQNLIILEYFPNKQLIIHEDWKWDVETCHFPNFDFKEWLHHFCEVLHHPRIDYLDFCGEDLDDNYIEPIQKIIKGLQIGFFGVWDELTNEFAKKVLQSFPNYEELYLAQIPFDNHKLNTLLVQNLKSLSIPEAQRLKIDQVLVSNSVTIKLSSSLLNEKDFNRFMKLWIRGSNPRLKYFVTTGVPQHGSVPLNENAILKGIKHNQIPLDSEEVYKSCVYNGYEKTKLAGGYRIWSFNGTTAVIVITECKFEFIVQ